MLKCPVRECKANVAVSFKSYVKYFKRKNPTADKFSKPKWYVYSLQAHLLKYHKCEELDSDNCESNNDRLRLDDENERNDAVSDSSNEEFYGFQLNESHNSNSNSNDGILVQRIDTPEIHENDGQPRKNPVKTTETSRKRTIASKRVLSPSKKYKT